MPKRLAITIAGAVSLGSYEAGVLWEVLDAIRQHNENSATTDDDRIVIDVITGASAGGMTATILAQKLLYSADEFNSPYDNPLYQAWVERIDLKGLQDTGTDQNALLSIFSSDLIATISKELLTARYAANPKPEAKAHAAVGSQLSLGLALTNLNGVAFSYPVTPGGEFTYINYSDQMTRVIDAAKCDNGAFWEQLRAGAVASGAFPIAFRTQGILRSKEADADDFASPNLRWDGKPTTFTYSDGGILQNQPLGMAKNLVDPIDRHREEKRFYLFVSPHAKDPTSTAFAAGDATYLRVLKQLIGVAVGQAGFRDWITAGQVNERVHLLDVRASQLKDAILGGHIDIQALQTTAGQLLRLMFRTDDLQPGATKIEALADAQERIAVQYKTEMSELAALPGAAQAFRDSVLAFENAAGLGARDIMTIYGITAKDTELAGASLQAFLGFFDQRYRDHDYDIGRTHAQQVLQDACMLGDNQLGPLRFTPGTIRPIDHSLDGPQLHRLSPATKDLFHNGLKHRINQITRDTHLGLTDLVVDLIVGRLIDQLTAPVKQDPADPLGLED